tara:strand:+ start:979 stop:1185 length:207 start_codon:yes stop_codon:yes gene_type:complete
MANPTTLTPELIEQAMRMLEMRRQQARGQGHRVHGFVEPIPHIVTPEFLEPVNLVKGPDGVYVPEEKG